MTDQSTPYKFKYDLLDRALHFDFLRLRCGSEAAFHRAVHDLGGDATERPRTFAAMSEWDAVVILPSKQLYPESLNRLYGSYDIESTTAGTAGYFAYLWNHPLNHDLDSKLNRFEGRGVGMLISLRFDDWVRRHFGLAAEILFCDHLARHLSDYARLSQPEPALTAIVAHTLGWNDIVVVAHAIEDEHNLRALQSAIRLLTLREILPPGKITVPDEYADAPVFTASYTHVIGGYATLVQGEGAMGSLADEVESATLLLRVAPAQEWLVRDALSHFSAGELKPENMPTEVGHYTFSVDITSLVKDGNGGRRAMQLLSDVRRFIGSAGNGTESFNSYAETTTIFRFREPVNRAPNLRLAPADPTLKESIGQVKKLMDSLRDKLRGPGGSPMTAHRFATVLTTLLDNLSDPIRRSVVRHVSRFLVETKDLDRLSRQDLADLCQIAEYAITQATDGLAQFQHDANALGVAGRGGYSRLIAAIESYVDDIFASFGIFDKDVLITFGLRVGHAGSMARFHIDVPFNVLFVPSRWYILLHEVGHIVWVRKFGWMPESLAIYEQLENDIHYPSQDKAATARARELIRAEFIRTREMIRELFPNLIVFLLTCGGTMEAFNRLSLRHILSHSRPGAGTRELLVAVVLNCILTMIDQARQTGERWFSAYLREQTAEEIRQSVQKAISSVRLALTERPPGLHVDDHIAKTLKNKTALLVSEPFCDAACEAVQSVLKVLRHLAAIVTNQEHLSEALFTDIQNKIASMIDEQQNVETWIKEGFAAWITRGEVLAVAPPPHVWAKLLHDSRDQLRQPNDSRDQPGQPAESSGFMVSQLAALLSIWHRAAVSVDDKDTAALSVLANALIPLELVTRKTFSTAAPDATSAATA